jgi:hypothetical protein
VQFFFGRISGKGCRSLDGAIYNGQDRLAGFRFTQDGIIIDWKNLIFQLVQDKINNNLSRSRQSNHLLDSEIDDAISYVQHALQRQSDFEYADLQRCMTMNYQAAILHNQQHAAASLLLNFSVAESLILEIFEVYGLVNNSSIKSFATKIHNASKISRKDFKNAPIELLIKNLHEGNLLDHYLFQRIESARKARDNLMHKGDGTSCPKDSGPCQSIVRDLWEFLLETPFELMTGWSYLR